MRKLELEAFSVLKTIRRFSRGRNEAFNNPPLWANQVRNLSLREVSAEAYVNVCSLNLPIQRPELWTVFFDPAIQALFKSTNQGNIYLDASMSLDQRGNLHCETDAAFVSGRVERFFLHGVHIEDSSLVLTPAEDLDVQRILRISNVDVRREMIRKKGIEQFLNNLFHRTVDEKGDYSLVEILLGNASWTSGSKFLKMLNPSIGCWHLEGVPNEVQTVEDALKWRNNNWFAHADDIT